MHTYVYIYIYKYVLGADPLVDSGYCALGVRVYVVWPCLSPLGIGMRAWFLDNFSLQRRVTLSVG